MIPAMLDAHFSLLNYAFYSKNYHPIIIENEEGITDIGLKYVNNEMCYPAILNKKEEKIMLKNERKIVDILIKYSDYLFVLAITILSIYIRNRVLPIVSGDANYFLLPWYEEIKNSGGLDALSKQTGDYCILYQTLIALFTYLPLKPLVTYKVISCIFDYLLALACVMVIRELTENRLYMIWTFVLVVCSPIVIFNSSAWAQCDSIYATFCAWTIYFCIKEKYSFMFIAYGVALSLKLQAIFLLPFIFIIYLIKKQFSIIKIFYVPFMMIVLSGVGIIYGRKIWDVFLIFKNQTQAYNSSLTSNYPGLWAIFSTEMADLNIKYSTAATMISICIIGMIFYYLMKKMSNINKEQILQLAFIFVYIAVLTMPHMHERYGYLYEIFAIMLALLYKRTIIPCIILQLITFFTYSSYLFKQEHMLTVLAVINIGIFIYYFWIFFVQKENEKTENLCNNN